MPCDISDVVESKQHEGGRHRTPANAWRPHASWRIGAQEPIARFQRIFQVRSSSSPGEGRVVEITDSPHGGIGSMNVCGRGAGRFVTPCLQQSERDRRASRRPPGGARVSHNRGNVGAWCALTLVQGVCNTALDTCFYWLLPLPGTWGWTGVCGGSHIAHN